MSNEFILRNWIYIAPVVIISGLFMIISIFKHPEIKEPFFALDFKGFSIGLILINGGILLIIDANKVAGRELIFGLLLASSGVIFYLISIWLRSRDLIQNRPSSIYLTSILFILIGLLILYYCL